MILIKTFYELVEKEFEELEVFDLKLVQKYGNSFSNEIWSVENFKYKLPQKEELSCVLFIGNKIVGYVVASLKNESIYIHRFVVDKKGYANKFLKEIIIKYEEKDIYLMVNIVNQNAIDFYKKFNFQTVCDEEIIKSFVAKELTILNNEILIGEDYRCYLMKKD